MGGYGSGRHLPNPKTAVEDALTIRVGALLRSFRESERLADGAAWAGTLTWRQNGRTTAEIGTRVWWERGANGEPERPRVRLSYAVVRGEDREPVHLDLATDATPGGFGGVRRWLRCPGARASDPCGRRVGTLHLPPGATRFACRDCHRLTYRSRQESRQFDGLFRRLAAHLGTDPAFVRRALSRM